MRGCEKPINDTFFDYSGSFKNYITLINSNKIKLDNNSNACIDPSHTKQQNPYGYLNILYMSIISILKLRFK